MLECAQQPRQTAIAGQCAGAAKPFLGWHVRIDTRLFAEQRQQRQEHCREALAIGTVPIPIDSEPSRYFVDQPAYKVIREDEVHGCPGNAGNLGIEQRALVGKAGHAPAETLQQRFRAPKDLRALRIGAEEEQRVVKARQELAIVDLRADEGDEQLAYRSGVSAAARDIERRDAPADLSERHVRFLDTCSCKVGNGSYRKVSCWLRQ